MPALRPAPAPTRASTLDERIAAIHADMEAIIEDRIAVEAASAVGVPRQVIRQMFDARYGRCLCRAYEQMTLESDEKAREAAQQKAAEKLSREWKEAAGTMEPQQ
jgi:hypothetical protein